MDRISPHVVIVGGGFGGLQAARILGRAAIRVTLIDQSNHHLFQPLLYQVATGVLSPGEIALPIRSILKKHKNTEVVLSRVSGVDAKSKQVLLCDGARIGYDYLILATGARHSYFKNPEWEKLAPGLKSIKDGTMIRQKLLTALELAEKEPNPQIRTALLTFVTVGGGPTGVELTGAMAEISNHVVPTDFRHINPEMMRFYLIESSPRVLKSFSEASSRTAQRKLESFGVKVLTSRRVDQVDEDGVTVGEERIRARNVIWAAGVVASPAAKWLGIEADKTGRAVVRPDLTAPGHPEVFIIGDTAKVEQDGETLPGVASVAIQQGRYVARVILRRLEGRSEIKPFHYLDKGNLATIGRTFAIAEFFNGKIRVSGFLGQLIWAFVHIYFLAGLRGKLGVLFLWVWTLVTFGGASRLIDVDSPDECPSDKRDLRKVS